jgi:hypothetical protein
MYMRDLITLCESLGHKVMRDGPQGGVFALNPTRREWVANFAERGAAGVVLSDGSLAVGDAPALDHPSILLALSIPVTMERYRLQIFNQRIVVELWDELDEPEGDITDDQIEATTRYPKSVRIQIASEVNRCPAVQRLGFPVVIQLRTGVGCEDRGFGQDIWLEETF